MTMTPLEAKHLDWSNKQSRILTANGEAVKYYVEDRSFPFRQDELPHYHLGRGETHEVFASWLPPNEPLLICGAWERPLFCGSWEHSTDQDEKAYNLQTNTLFIDLRIPTSRRLVLPDSCSSLSSLTNHQLRLYARQHVFGGFSHHVVEKGRHVCTRHHCIDWNYVGTPRPRPNKWFVEMSCDNHVWKEWAYATDDHGQHYYMERWERLDGGSSADGIVLALRRRQQDGDGIVVVVGDHFNYLFDRTLTGKEDTYGKGSLVDLVDFSIAYGDRETAEAFLGIDAGHGRVSGGWMIDAAIQPWKEGTAFITSHDHIRVIGTSIECCHVQWNDVSFEVYECSLDSVDDLSEFLQPISNKRQKTGSLSARL
jgi:hypothetical protein